MGSQDFKKYLDGLLPDHCKEANSTRHLRELKPSEVKQMALPNRGKHLSRAGRRRLSPAAWVESEKIFRRDLRQAEERDKLDRKTRRCRWPACKAIGPPTPDKLLHLQHFKLEIGWSLRKISRFFFFLSRILTTSLALSEKVKELPLQYPIY